MTRMHRGPEVLKGPLRTGQPVRAQLPSPNTNPTRPAPCLNRKTQLNPHACAASQMAPALVAPCGRRVPGAVVHGHSACLWAERASAGRFLGRSPGGLSNTRHDGHNICNSGSFPSCYRNRLRPRVCGLVVASATSMDGGVSPVPQRPGGGPPASTREDLVLQRLRRADSVRGVLDIYRQVGAAVGRGGAAAAAGGGAALLMEVLRALARATGKLSNADLAELQVRHNYRKRSVPWRMGAAGLEGP